MYNNESGRALIKVSMPKINHDSLRVSWRATASVDLPELDAPLRTITSTGPSLEVTDLAFIGAILALDLDDAMVMRR
jgi:hypothetical protein